MDRVFDQGFPIGLTRFMNQYSINGCWLLLADWNMVLQTIQYVIR